MPKPFTRRRFLKNCSNAGAFAALSGFAIPKTAQAAPSPNIVFIMADDLGYGDLGCYGCKDIRSPAADRLAAQGVRFTQYYANAPECTPPRTALLTGRYQQRVGGLECAIGNGHVGRYDDAIRLREQNELGLPTNELTIVRMLKEKGYRTGICGKWHLGYDPKFSPLKHGFDYFFGPLGGGIDYFHHTEPSGWHTLRLNDQPVHREGYITDLITDEAVRYIQREKEKPFFLYVPYTSPHSPYQGPDAPHEVRKNDETWNQGSRESYVAMVERMDQGIGRILDELDRYDLSENTVVFFVSDNGGAKYANNKPFSGNKGQTFEGGIHVPAIVRWPGRIEAGTVTNQVSITMDLTASIANIAAVTPPKNRPFDGIDVLKLASSSHLPSQRTLFWRKRRGVQTWRAVRDGDLKYVSLDNDGKLKEHLFDLKNDPAEKTDLIDRRKKDFTRLKKLLVQWEKDVQPVR